MRFTQRTLAGLAFLLAVAAGVPANAVERDLAYGGEALQTLDLWTPEGQGFPTVVFIHGGSLNSGDKADSDYGKVCEPFAAAGIGCANVNHRLLPASAWPNQAEDVVKAVAWVRENIAARGGDPNRLVLMGHSSGALLSTLVGNNPVYLQSEGLKPGDLAGVIAMGSIMWDPDVQNAVDSRGREAVAPIFNARHPAAKDFGDLDTYLGMWPINHIHADAPPILFLIAESEQQNPPVLMTNRTFAERSQAVGNNARYEVLPGRTHYSAIRRFAEPQDPVFELVRAYVMEVAGAP